MPNKYPFDCDVLLARDNEKARLPTSDEIASFIIGKIIGKPARLTEEYICLVEKANKNYKDVKPSMEKEEECLHNIEVTGQTRKNHYENIMKNLVKEAKIGNFPLIDGDSNCPDGFIHCLPQANCGSTKTR